MRRAGARVCLLPSRPPAVTRHNNGSVSAPLCALLRGRVQRGECMCKRAGIGAPHQTIADRLSVSRNTKQSETPSHTAPGAQAKALPDARAQSEFRHLLTFCTTEFVLFNRKWPRRHIWFFEIDVFQIYFRFTFLGSRKCIFFPHSLKEIQQLLSSFFFFCR